GNPPVHRGPRRILSRRRPRNPTAPVPWDPEITRKFPGSFRRLELPLGHILIVAREPPERRPGAPKGAAHGKPRRDLQHPPVPSSFLLDRSRRPPCGKRLRRLSRRSALRAASHRLRLGSAGRRRQARPLFGPREPGFRLPAVDRAPLRPAPPSHPAPRPSHPAP